MLTSAIASTEKRSNPLGFQPSSSVIVVMVDGLGLQNLLEFAGHAPFLIRSHKANPSSLRSECPSTTVLSLASVASGLRAGQHGLVGYTVIDSVEGTRVNLLSGWEQGQGDPAGWKTYETLAERHPGVVRVVAPSQYARSGFTALTLAGAVFNGVDEMSSRFEIARREAKTSGVTYLYLHELDQAGHKFGPKSSQWISVLEQIDSEIQTLVNAGIPTVLTADHGMVEADEQDHVYLEQLEALQEIDFETTGDTRFAALHMKVDDLRSTLEDLTAELGERATVATWQELIDAGWQVDGVSRAKRPEIVVLAQGRTVLYDRRTAKPQSLRMLGHHGSYSDAETRVPLIRWGI